MTSLEKVEKLEQAINNSRLFCIDKENESEYYENEKAKLLKDVIDYCRYSNYWKKSFKEICGNIFDAFNNCLKSYKKEKGNLFLNYFSIALKNEIKKSYKEEQDKFKSESLHKENRDEDNSLMLINTIEYEDDKRNYESAVNQKKSNKILDNINQLFKTSHANKELLKKLLTIEFEYILDTSMPYEFIDREILNNCKDEKKPSQKSIAKEFDLEPASVNRTLNSFKENLKSVCKELQ
ncbi:hypothetical protein AGMMS49938_18430 [Fibrobacterales bacterium]|nr:hypothetical protein AGMMS49938_18430 [Fibrobacterales bacterium]